jgi:hypothetical protein
MSLPNFTVSRFGQANAAGDDRALFLTKFAGEVMATYQAENIMVPLQRIRDIDNGKGADFPIVGNAVTQWHVPGTMIDGQVIKQNQRTIYIDDLLISPVTIANIDEAMTHFDLRQPYTTAVGRSLARDFDKRSLVVVGLTARNNTPLITGETTMVGASVSVANTDTDSDVLAAEFFTAAAAMDTKNVPSQERYAAVRPVQYYKLVQNTKVVSRSYADPNGSYAKGNVYELAGFELKKSNNIPSTNIANDAALSGAKNTYYGDFTLTTCLLWQKEAIGTVRLRDLATEMAYLVQNQSTLIVSKYLQGTGQLRPSCAYEIKHT